jgi:hypothetical protein
VERELDFLQKKEARLKDPNYLSNLRAKIDENRARIE